MAVFHLFIQLMNTGTWGGKDSAHFSTSEANVAASGDPFPPSFKPV